MTNTGLKQITQYFSFYSESQNNSAQSLNDREFANYQQRYRNWEDRVRDRLIEIFEIKTIKAHEDIILQGIYAHKPQKFEKSEFMNKSIDKIKLVKKDKKSSRK